MTIIIDGQKLAKQKEKKLADGVVAFHRRVGVFPKLVVIVVGNDPASQIYLEVKEKVARRVGVLFEKKKFLAKATPSEIVECIHKLNKDVLVHGIMVQLPLPKRLEIENRKLEILGSIEPRKDVDCLTPENLGLLMLGKPRFLPATVKAVMKILIQTARDSFLTQFFKGKGIVVVGAGNLVGKPLAIHLKNLGASVCLCDEYTKNLTEFTKKAGILISATGRPGLIKKGMVKKGAVVIDVGSPKGDVDFKEVQEITSAITPVPGGVGPLTVISLLESVFMV